MQLIDIVQSGLEGVGSAKLILLVFLKSTLLLFAAWLVTRRVTSAAARHLVWGAALVGVLLVPAATMGLPGVELAVLPAHLTGWIDSAGVSIRPEVERPEVEKSGTGPRLRASGEVASQGSSASLAAAATASDRHRSVPPTLVQTLSVVWLAGTAWLLCRLGAGLLERRRIERSSLTIADRRLHRRLAALKEELGIARPVELVSSTRLDVAATWGSLRPIIALPSSYATWSVSLTRSVLLHELAHVRRLDAPGRLVSGLVCALHWPNPWIWSAAAAMRRESELACDDVVVSVSGSPARYAEHLLAVVRSLRGPVPTSIAAMASQSGLGARIGAILDETRDRARPGRARVATTLAGMTLLIGAVGAPITLAEQRGELEASAPAFSAASWADRCGEGSRSMSTHGDNDRQRIEVKAGRCRLAIDLKGDIVFLDDETGVARLSRGSRLEIDEKVDGVRRRIELEPGDDGRPEIEWEVDGRPAEFDAAAQEWLATMIPQIFRMTGLDAEARVGRILRMGGVAAVFEEVSLIRGDHVQRKYLVHLMGQADLSATETRQWLETAGDEIGSDYELAETLGVLPVGDLGQSEIQVAFATAAQSIGSDYEMRRTLQRLLDQDRLSAGVLEPLLALAETIGSDYECAELLVGIARRFPGDELPMTYYEVAASIGSDYEMRRALTEVADRPMAEPALSKVLEAASQIGSDYELAELLVRLIRRHGVSDGVRDAFEAALETIGSQHERGRVLEAWHRVEG